MTPAGDIARMLGERIEELVHELLPGGHREGRSWRAGSVSGEPGYSLTVELVGPKRGLWLDHANRDHRGDALDLVKAALGCSTAKAIRWAKGWLGLTDDDIEPRRPAPAPAPVADNKRKTWPGIWKRAGPIPGSVAETYLRSRGLYFADPRGDVLRFEPRRARRSLDDTEFEHHPALLALLCDVRTGEACGVHNIYLRPDGSDRLRDKKGKTTTGPWETARAVMPSEFEDVTHGLTIAEGIETAISLLMDDLAPAWAICGASNLAKFPILSGIEAVTVAADTGEPGQRAAQGVAARWRKAGLEIVIIKPRNHGDWADPRKVAADD